MSPSYSSIGENFAKQTRTLTRNIANNVILKGNAKPNQRTSRSSISQCREVRRRMEVYGCCICVTKRKSRTIKRSRNVEKNCVSHGVSYFTFKSFHFNQRN